MAENKRRGEEPADDNNELVESTAADERADDGADRDRERSKKTSGRVGPVGRLGRFFREVVAELRKVIWPTRKELITYTGVVIVFLAVMTAITVGLDYGFAKAILAVFGD